MTYDSISSCVGFDGSEFLLPSPPCPPSGNHILSRLAQRGVSEESTRLREHVRALLPEAHQALSMRSVGRILDIEARVDIGRSRLPKPIQQATHLGVGLCTVGGDIDALAGKLRTKGRWLDSWICEAFAIAALDDLCNHLVSYMRDRASTMGCNASRAYAPGTTSGAWDLSNQRLVFDWLAADDIGVQLTPHLVMVPIKSRTFIIGIGRRIRQAETPFGCHDCTDTDCLHRRLDGTTNPGKTAPSEVSNEPLAGLD